MLSLRPARALCLAFFVSSLQAAEVNHSAPAFSLPNSQKSTRSLADYRGKVVFINFWASWCAPCRVELPQLAKLGAAYKGRGLRVIAINVDQDRARAKAMLGELGLGQTAMEILWDTQARVVKTYNAEAMPTSYILDQKGMIRYKHSGFRPEDPAAWRQEIDSLLTKR